LPTSGSPLVATKRTSSESPYRPPGRCFKGTVRLRMTRGARKACGRSPLWGNLTETPRPGGYSNLPRSRRELSGKSCEEGLSSFRQVTDPLGIPSDSLVVRVQTRDLACT
jgi:hypothetical protein